MAVKLRRARDLPPLFPESKPKQRMCIPNPRRLSMKRLAIIIFVLAFTLPVASQVKRPLSFDDLISMGRISDPQISPDGRTIAFVVTYHSKSENSTNSNIYLVPLAGGSIRQLTSAKGQNANPKWSPDGRTLFFVSSRDGESQVWKIPVGGGEAQKVTTISTGVSGLVHSRDGKWLGFSSEIYPDCVTDDCNKKKNEEMARSKVKAKMFESLPYRVWNHWKDGKRSHFFVQRTSGDGAIDLTTGDYDTPPIDLGGYVDYDISPDGKEAVFTRNTDPMLAISTNNDLFIVPIEGGTPKRITTNPANDNQPLYSPDGKYIAYRRMERAGFEADQQELVLYERATGNHINLTRGSAYSVGEVAWSPDSKSLTFDADDKGSHSIFRIGIADRMIVPLITNGYNRSLRIAPDGKKIVFIRESMNQPADMFTMDVSGKNLSQLTFLNRERVAELEMHPAEGFWFDGAGGTKVHGWLVKPPSFDPAKKYPMVYLVHGGPQGQWGDQFHFRWSAQMFAARGYVVVLVNPRGSTGYGQQFTDEISGDWGGKVYEDLMKGLDYVVNTYDYVDGNRIAAAGASYGGYMMNWMAGHTDRFRCMVTHAGVYNLASMYGTTEELWFPEWEFKGTYYENPELYKKWSPLEYASNFRTPTLVVHGQLDYRVDISEGFQLFTALQRQGVKSKMLYFPDEGHWVGKPQNAELWWKTVLDWIDEHTK